MALTPTQANSSGTYTPPAGNSVAWAWDYNSADPSVNGFEIINYTGNVL